MSIITPNKSIITPSNSIISANSSVIANGGGGGFTPSDDTDLISWWDTLFGISDTGGLVNSWTPKSGSSSLDLTQTSTARPTTNSRTINNINVLDSDGGDWLEALNFVLPSSGNVTIMMACAIDSVASSGTSLFSFSDAGGTNSFQLQANNASQFDGIVISLLSTSAVFSGSPYSGNHILHIVWDFDSDEFIAYVDNVAVISATLYTTKFDITLDGLRIFKNRGGGTNIPNGAIADIIITESVDQAGIITDHYDYLAAKYAI